MKKLLKGHDKAGPIVNHVEGRCPFEAWRLVHCRMDPINDQAAGASAKAVLDPKRWVCSHMSQISVMLARWEGLQQEHLKRTGESLLTPSAARALLMDMIPTKLSEHIKIQTLLMKRKDLTYEVLRNFIVEHCDSVATVQGTPMDIGALTANDYPWGAELQAPAPEPLDSFGKAANGAAVGKGVAAKGAQGNSNGENNSERPCLICGRKTHQFKTCWFKDEKDPKKPAQTKGDAAIALVKAKGGSKGKGQRGKDGKFYRKTGIHSWEEVSEGEVANASTLRGLACGA